MLSGVTIQITRDETLLLLLLLLALLMGRGETVDDRCFCPFSALATAVRRTRYEFNTAGLTLLFLSTESAVAGRL